MPRRSLNARKNKSTGAPTKASRQLPHQSTSKSELIRTYFREHPSAKPKEVVQALKEQGQDVSYNLVATIKSKGGMKGHTRRRSISANAPTTSARDGIVLSDSLDAAIVFIRTSGGMEAAKAALARIEEIRNL